MLNNKIHKNISYQKSHKPLSAYDIFYYFYEYVVGYCSCLFFWFIIKMSHESAKHQSALFIYVICRSIKETTELILILPSNDMRGVLLYSCLVMTGSLATDKTVYYNKTTHVWLLQEWGSISLLDLKDHWTYLNL